MPIEYTDILQPAADNPAGTRLKLYYAPVSDFATIAKPTGDDSGTDNTDLVAIKTDHTFKTGKCFKVMELEVNKNEISGEQQGEVVGGAQKQTLTGFISNQTPAILGALKLAKRTKHIVLAVLADDQVKQLGQENNGAMLKYNTQTGTQEGGERGVAITIMAHHDDLFYEGEISTTPAP